MHMPFVRMQRSVFLHWKLLTTQKLTKQKKSLPGIFPSQLQNRGKPHNSEYLLKFLQTLGKKIGIFQAQLPSLQAAKASTPHSCRASSCCQGMPLTPAPRTTHATGPPPFLPWAGSQKASSLPIENVANPSHYWPVKAGPDTRNRVHNNIWAPLSTPL